MAAAPSKKSNKEEEEEDLITIDEVAKETKSFIDSVFGDVGKSSAVKQLIIGSISGWCTGFITMKVGKVAALAVGGGIILLQVANHQGYIKINWDQVYKQVDKVEEKATGRGQKWMDKVERYVDRKLDKAEDVLSRQERRAKKWYHRHIIGEEPYQVKEIHIFLVAFFAGVAIGVASG